MPQVAQPAWQLLYGGTNITGNLIQHAARLDYYEVIGGKANHLEITLEDASRAFQNNPPTPGTVVGLAIGYVGANLVNCGNFEVDEWQFHGPPDLFVLRCLQAGISQSLRTPKSVAWNNMDLTAIAGQIANNYGMTAVVDAVVPNVYYNRLTQRLESDLGFLHRIANAHNYDFNIRGSQLVFYSRPQLESANPVATLAKTDDCRFSIHKQHVGHRAYKSAKVGYFNPQSKALVTQLATDPNATSQDTLNIVERMENTQQGTLRASAHLHTANMLQIQGEFTIPGTMLFRAGNTMMIQGFGDFDSVKFIVSKGRHTLTPRGYYTTLTLRNTISGTGLTQIISDEFEG